MTVNPKHLIFICTEFELGTSIGEVSRIYGSRGGSLMWRIKTGKGGYAVKQLAPVIDLTSERIVTKYELSETIASRFESQGISAVYAKTNYHHHLSDKHNPLF